VSCVSKIKIFQVGRSEKGRGTAKSEEREEGIIWIEKRKEIVEGKLEERKGRGWGWGWEED
jgi:hypothetical protein